MRLLTSHLLLAGLTASLLGCANCEREGCDALDERATGAGTGLGGVIAARSDVVADGCTECPLGEARLAIWRVDAPVTTEAEAIAVVGARDPDTTEDVSGRYQLELAPAAYLLCMRPSCVAVDVVADQTATVNIEQIEGPPRFFLSRPNLEGLQAESGFSVGY